MDDGESWHAPTFDPPGKPPVPAADDFVGLTDE